MIRISRSIILGLSLSLFLPSAWADDDEDYMDETPTPIGVGQTQPISGGTSFPTKKPAMHPENTPVSISDPKFVEKNFIKKLKSCLPGVLILDGGINTTVIKGFRAGKCNVNVSTPGLKQTCKLDQKGVALLSAALLDGKGGEVDLGAACKKSKIPMKAQGDNNPMLKHGASKTVPALTKPAKNYDFSMYISSVQRCKLFQGTYGDLMLRVNGVKGRKCNVTYKIGSKTTYCLLTEDQVRAQVKALQGGAHWSDDNSQKSLLPNDACQDKKMSEEPQEMQKK